MNTIKSPLSWLIILITFAFTPVDMPQEIYVLNAKHDFSVSGTSNLHDWTMTTSDADGSAEILIAGNEIKKIEKLTIELKANSLKSDKKGMDKKCYEALKTEQYPEIRYTLEYITSETVKNDTINYKTKGQLTVAGVTKTIDMKVKGKVMNGKVFFAGEKKLKMSDFNVDPPTALLGTVKTGDEIVVSFEILFHLKK